MHRYLVDRLRIPASYVRCIPNGVAIPPQQERAAPARVFVSVGSFAPCKAMPDLVAAFIRVADGRPHVRLVLVGDGPDRRRCADLVARAGLDHQVTFAGYRTDVGSVLLSADAFVLPSLNDNQPLALLEAMAAGLPCVATAVGGIPEVLDGVGLLVPPGDHWALATAMGRLLDDDELAARLGSQARRRVHDHFGMATCGSAHLRLWHELAGAAS